MFKVSNYCEQSKNLPVQDGFQLICLQWADASTILREGSKIGFLVGLTVSISSNFFNFKATPALVFTAVCAVSWLLFRTCAQKLEPQARNMIKSFQESKTRQHLLTPQQASSFGLNYN